MLGGTISDLEAGDVFKPVEYVLTPFMCSEYAHGVETGHEAFHSARGGRQMRPPIHVDKMRILEANCLKERRVSAGGRITTDAKGPDARIHYEYHSRQHSAAYVGERLIVSGKITKQVREATAPRVNVPRQSKRPVERSKQRRSRGS